MDDRRQESSQISVYTSYTNEAFHLCYPQRVTAYPRDGVTSRTKDLHIDKKRKKDTHIDKTRTKDLHIDRKRTKAIHIDKARTKDIYIDKTNHWHSTNIIMLSWT